MKKLLGVIAALIILYSIYFDLSVGTLPQADFQKANNTVAVNSNPTIPYFEAAVEPGETLISIVEHKLKKTLPVPITDLVKDFQTLNPGKKADQLQVGKTYRFPDYTKNND